MLTVSTTACNANYRAVLVKIFDMDLGVDRIVPAVIGIDLHRGHLDPTVATMPLEARRATILVEANRKFFSAVRRAYRSSRDVVPRRNRNPLQSVLANACR
jgi:hypothetical protein